MRTHWSQTIIEPVRALYSAINAYKYVIVALVLTVALPLSGALLFLEGISDYNLATFEKKDIVFSDITIFAAGNDTEIADMLVQADKASAIEEGGGWMGCIIEFTSSDHVMALEFSLKKEIKWVHFLNYTSCPFFDCSWNYSDSLSLSTINVAYASLSDETRIRIIFDWRVLEKVSADKEMVSIAFENLTPLNNLYREHYPVTLAGVYYPVIRKLAVEIRHDWTPLFSLTIPEPTQLLILDWGGFQEKTVRWVFDFDKQISSVQAVFLDATTSYDRDATVFRSGLYQAFGISMMIGGLTDLLVLLRRYLLRRRSDGLTPPSSKKGHPVQQKDEL